MSLKENIDANKKHQEELKKVQQSRDRGNTCKYLQIHKSFQHLF